MARSRHVIDDRVNSFCKDSDVYVPGRAGAPLSDLTFAAKDIFDVASHTTGSGNPDWKVVTEPARETAWAVHALLEDGATLVGKTITEELTLGIFGDNSQYGVPINPRAPDRLPGGSSSGSASAVAAGLVDFALGSDSGGSVRVPASFCGLYGIRPTHGRIPVDGMLPQAPSYDTVGWFARDAETFARVGRTLLQSEIGDSRRPRLIIAKDAFDIADSSVADALRPVVEIISSLARDSTEVRLAETGLDRWAHQHGTLQGLEAWDTMRDWIDRANPRFRFDSAEGYYSARTTTESDAEAARSLRQEVRSRMGEVLADGAVVCLPTTAEPAPPLGQRLSARQNTGLLTCIAGTAGAPQVSLPLADVDGLPVGLSLIGEPGTDEALIAFARVIADAT